MRNIRLQSTRFILNELYGSVALPKQFTQFQTGCLIPDLMYYFKIPENFT